MRQPVRLMIIDDSLVARTALRRMIDGDDALEVTALASTAENALETLRRTRVDVILLDLDMPGMGGLEALPKIIERARGARILVVSALTVDGAEHTLAALSLGAADTLPKPESGSLRDGYREILIGKIRELGRAAAAAEEPAPATVLPVRPARLSSRATVGALAIGASTGGIHALASLFAGLPPRLGVPIFVTQHLPCAFMPAFARQLKIASGYETLVAEEGLIVERDRILIAPGDAHLMFETRSGRLTVRLDRKPSATGCMPSVDPMFRSLADEIGDRAFGVVLSGMGRDGAQGAARIVATGGTVLAQDEASCAVWGMPRAVAEAGLASAILPPAEIASRIVASVGAVACR
ncbi:chemotaxis-specific protein-glutamate methyltransferase CheB [Novosphingobium mangrovi (ex Huang et al. 2023)]|uniref:Protein-glutamate methylesterase/protein-glutamine glutaminase n=1 Tax=Novosphingobium mangrovi (ex Huang et al. 2023) TaxID=2976432 RepID=A0ABT2I492_9SPHN|nr:chemotaxis-specific protein-glutamate methyltransferase CheB [Novosphingobium mangrovi (ex Huang et al. 2023)]MCT2399620.1 chemotaxis-specific protein-glutamate methyltransferase CheB [Novosphingobium mangrovi (ex Huang et al. 2023)]